MPAPTVTLANSYTYDTWGRPTTATHNAIGDLGFRFTYTGEFDVQWDDAFGLDLLYMHARHYSPALGRFLQPDPDGSESNLYAYTANNPVTELDPDGTCFILCAVVNAVIDTAIYLATTDSSEWDAGEIAVTAATGAATGFLGVGLLSKVTKVGSLAVKAVSRVPKAGRALSRLAQRGGRAATSCARHSFDGDTLVTLADGSRVPIEDLSVGDKVLAWDELTGRTGAYPISATWVHDDPVTGLVVIDGEAIATTPGHPFYVAGRGWVEASELRVGDQVPSADGGPGTVQAITWSRGPDTMYDLTVAVAHTFFVGAGGWLVHNVDPCPNPWGRAGSPDHRAPLVRAQGALEGRGWRPVSGLSRPERAVRVPSGRTRFADLVLERGGRRIAIQSGRRTLAGRPIAREGRALADLRASGEFDHVFFLGYR